MKKRIFCLLLFPIVAFGQTSDWKLNAVGVDLGKNLPSLLANSFYRELTGVRSAVFIEPTVQFALPKPNRFVNFTLGFANFQEQTADLRVVRNMRSVYVQVLREHQNQKQFWNYGGFINVTSGNGYINVPGNFFEDYRAAIPNFVGSAIGIKTQAGFVSKIATKWRLRSFGHLSFNYSSISSPNARNIAGGGSALFLISGLSPTYGISFQLFYLPKAVQLARSN